MLKDANVFHNVLCTEPQKKLSCASILSTFALKNFLRIGHFFGFYFKLHFIFIIRNEMIFDSSPATENREDGEVNRDQFLSSIYILCRTIARDLRYFKFNFAH